MSTRSGRRIHNDDIIPTEVDVVLKSERKTRSKRVVDNGEGQEVTLKPKKRQNYVSYPSEEGDGGPAIEIDAQCKPARSLRRTTLKEQNALVEEVHITNVKTQTRQTRRNKKLSETTAEDMSTEPNHQEIIEEVTITNGKPKNKKNKKKATKVTDQEQVMDKENAMKGNKKKKNKRKKNSQSNSLVGTEEIKMSKGENNTSTESFHSAAGSPVHGEGTSSKESGTLLIDHTSPCNNTTKANVKIGLNSSARLAVDTDMVLNSTFDKDSESRNKESNKRKSSLKNVTFEKEKPQSAAEKLNNTFDKEASRVSSGKMKRKSHQMEGTPEYTELQSKVSESAVDKTPVGIINTTFEKDDIVNDPDSKQPNNIKEQKNGLLSQDNSPRKSLRMSAALNGTFELSSKSQESKQKSLDSTFDKETKLNSTFDKEGKLDSTFDKTPQKPSSNKSSLISSDLTGSSLNITLDKSDISRISITDDDSKTENILNATPVLIESSLEDSKVLGSSEKKTPESKSTTTPLKREGTFTKEESEGALTLKQTPSKRQTLPVAGCTPYHSNNKGPKNSVLNRTHLIEKQRSSVAELPRATRVMFCSPVNNPLVVTQHKTKVIKSSLKGSNKSFVHEENEPPARCGSRKRSLTAAGAAPDAAPDAAPGAKRARLPPQPRARTASAMAKMSSGATPAKALTPGPKSELKATRLPNFAALHARGFERMESLDECQRRRARRARTLLQPTGSLDIIQKSSPKVTPAKPVTPAEPPKLPTLDTLQRGYTRFGFKMDCVNPFSVPLKPADKPKEIKPKPIEKKPQPSLAGATSLRKAAAKHTIMREKSFTGKGKRDENRKECRTIIKGVRTNRRFELQMMSRNINL